jgi:hypothetical protein
MAWPNASGQKWYQQPRYANMVGQRPAGMAAGTATGPEWRQSRLIRQFQPEQFDAYVNDAVRKNTPPMAAPAPMRSADTHLQNVLAGTARHIYDDSFRTPFAHYSGHTVAVPGGGFRVHPMQISAPTTPRRPPQADPNDAGKWWTAPNASGDMDTDAHNAWALGVQKARHPAGGSWDINRNAQGVVTGFNVTGAMPTAQAARLAADRLNQGVTDPKMMYRAAGPNRITDPFGQEMSYEDARKRIVAMNTMARDQRGQQMADVARDRRQMDRERAQAAQWNMMMARQVDPRHPLSPIAQERAMTAAMPRRMNQNEMAQANLLDAQQQMQAALTREALGIERDRARQQMAGQITPQQQLQMQALQAAAADPNLSPQQQQQVRQQMLAAAGVAPGTIPQPQVFGPPSLRNLPPAISERLRAATDRNELWNIGTQEGVFTNGDDKSIALFHRLEKELRLDEPFMDTFMGLMPFATPNDLERIRRGEEPRSAVMTGARRWLQGK